MRALAVALACLPGLAAAQTAETCAALFERAGALGPVALSGEVAVVEVETTLFGEVGAPLPWCEATGVLVNDATLSARVEGRIDRLRWRGLDPLLEGGLPTEAWVEMEGLRIVPITGDPVFDWLLAAQQGPVGIDATLDAGVDADGAVALRSLRVDLPGRDAIDLSVETAGLDLSSRAAFEASLGRAGVTRASATVVMDGLFERYLLMPLGAAALDGVEDPAREAPLLRDALAAQMRLLPEAIFPGPTRGSLEALVAALPNPRGTLRLDLAAPEATPLGLPRFARFAITGLPRTPEEAFEALDGVTLGATWTPLPPGD